MDRKDYGNRFPWQPIARFAAGGGMPRERATLVGEQSAGRISINVNTTANPQAVIDELRKWKPDAA